MIVDRLKDADEISVKEVIQLTGKTCGFSYEKAKELYYNEKETSHNRNFCCNFYLIMYLVYYLSREIRQHES